MICDEIEDADVASLSDASGDEGHIHGADCYEQELICEKPEHTHTEDCYAESDEPDADNNSVSGNGADGEADTATPSDAEPTDILATEWEWIDEWECLI